MLEVDEWPNHVSAIKLIDCSLPPSTIHIQIFDIVHQIISMEELKLKNRQLEEENAML